ncbi:NUDIX domain-containing protein, partial [Planktotalea sp.]|uniref:NUDIX domain-containing protein n=1 Tax=Planktotalea sp. TaxID=2029877 RepID=UPI003296C728
LGGMLGWPGSEWSEEDAIDRPPMRAEWKTLNTEARHTFTHFHLRLTVKTALVPMDRAAKVGDFVPAEDFNASDLPTVMRKVFDLTAAGRK